MPWRRPAPARSFAAFPCIGGIDLSGTVIESADPRFKTGDPVIATSFDIGVAHHGGYAEIARVPGDWVVPLPAGLSLYDAMALGTAGFTAALAVVRMEENRLTPANGPVIVTGATGGVGSLAVDILAKRGYHVVALTGKESEVDYLRGLGAAEVMLRSTLDLTKIRPLDNARWAGAVDNLGGDVLAWIASTMAQGGTIASIGLAASMKLEYDSCAVHPARRFAAWHRFRIYQGSLSPWCLAASGKRHATAASGFDVAQDRVCRIAGNLRRIHRWTGQGARCRGDWRRVR